MYHCGITNNAHQPGTQALRFAFPNPDEAYRGLEQQLLVTGTLNRPLEQATAVVNGFLSAYGPAMTVMGLSAVD